MAQEKKPSFSDFGKTFQEKLAKLILLERPFADQVGEVIELGYFEYKHLQIFARLIFEHRDKYKSHPSVDAIAATIRSDLTCSDTLKKQIRAYFAKYFTTEADYRVADAEFIKDRALDFCKKQRLKVALFESVDLLQKSSFDQVATVINNALKLGADQDHGYDYQADFEDRYVIRHRHPVTTGWTLIDGITKGGLGIGELGVVIAPTGAGKSMVLCHLGAQAIKLGKTVVHYTLELADTLVALRYDSCITGVPINDLHVFKDNVHEQIKDVSGHLIVKEYPTKSATTRTLRNHIERLISRGIKPDMILVDYGDLLKFLTNYKEKRDGLESIYEELRSLAQEFGVPIWTASQTNRTGLNAEVITMDAIAEAFSKCFVADFIFSVSRTIDDKNTNQGRIFIAKSRLGPDGFVFPIYINTANVQIKVLKPNEGDEDAKEASRDAGLARIKEMYAKHRKTKKAGKKKNGGTK